MLSYVYSFPSGLANITPTPEPSKLKAPSVYNFYVLSGLGTLLVAAGFLVFVSLSSMEGVSAMKSARILLLTELRPLNSMSCSSSSIAYLAILPDFSGSMGQELKLSVELRQAARYITNTSPLIGAINVCNISINSFIFWKASSASAVHCMVFLSMQLLRALKNHRDLSAPFKRNMLSAANFPLRLYISLSVFGGLRSINMANVIPLNHVDDLPVVEPKQPRRVPAIPEHILVDEDEDPEEEEFEEEEEPQEEEEDMNIDDEEDENEPELTFPYEEADPLNLPPPASDSDPEDVLEVEDTVEPEDESVPASVHEVGESSTATFLREDGDRLLPGFMRRDIDSLFGRIASLSRRVCGRETAHALVEKNGKAKDK
ncbi:hypothetical protein Tco_1155344 [Tanacetum coccineum]